MNEPTLHVAEPPAEPTTDTAEEPRAAAPGCPHCGGPSVRLAYAQAADGADGPDGEPVEAGSAIVECVDCGTILAVVSTPAAEEPTDVATVPVEKHAPVEEPVPVVEPAPGDERDAAIAELRADVDALKTQFDAGIARVLEVIENERRGEDGISETAPSGAPEPEEGAPEAPPPAAP
jgi:hypothetical protein